MTKRRLKTMEDVRRYIANLINKTESGEVDGMLAGKLGYLSNILIKIIEGGQLEKRVDLLEKEINQRG